jgi:YtkA-like
LRGRPVRRSHPRSVCRDLAFLVAALAVLSLLSACGTAGGPAAHGNPSPKAATFAGTGAEFTAVLQVDPYPPRSMQQTLLDVTVSDLEGLPVQGATVTCDLTMPAMRMPPNKPQAVERTPGVYAAEAVFTMAGAWEAAVQVSLPDGRSETFRFALSAD